MKDLEDGTYCINDLMDFHEILDFKDEVLLRENVKKRHGRSR